MSVCANVDIDVVACESQLRERLRGVRDETKRDSDWDEAPFSARDEPIWFV